MRIWGRLAATACAVLVAMTLVPSTPVSAGLERPLATGQAKGAAADDPAARGMVAAGLRPAGAGSPCPHGFEVGPPGRASCTHGPDPAPPGVDVRRERSSAALAAEASSRELATAAAPGSILCLGDGTSGKRVQAIYAVASNRTDRFSTVAPLIPGWAQNADAAFNDSAAETGGERHVRWVTNPDCSLSVLKVVLSPSGDDDFDNTVDELYGLGFNRSDRKYLVWVDDTRYCGIGGIYDDDRPGQENVNNGVTGVPPLVARVDSGCWGRSRSVEAHELMHNLGGVQLSAPHTSDGFHCTDEYDLMCYDDDDNPLTAPLTFVCPSSHEPLFDCNHDDYYSTAPAAGSYLTTHWNTASNAFLTSTPAPVVDVTPPPVPGGLSAVPGNAQVSLSWSPVSASDLAGYRVRRNGAVVATVATTSFVDTGVANGSTYTYTVSSYDVSGNQSAESTPASATPQAPTPTTTTTTTTTTTAPPPAPPAGTVQPSTAPPTTPAPAPAPGGYRLVGADGRTFGFGDAGPLGSTGPLPVSPTQPVVDAAALPDGTGAWAVTGTGGVFTLGSAPFLGSTGAIRLNRPIVGMAATPTGGGYWLVATDGGIFAFGDARFFGSTGAIRLNQPIVGMASTPSGNGYWLVASDGGIFAFGAAPFFGSTGAIKLNQPIVGMAPTPTGAGYRFVASDGGVFSFGDARFLGSAANQGATITAMVSPAR